MAVLDGAPACIKRSGALAENEKWLKTRRCGRHDAAMTGRRKPSMDNMTALVSCFARAYHYRNSNLPVFADHIAEKMLTAEEYDAISLNMKQGIQYFAPDFHGTQEEVL